MQKPLCEKSSGDVENVHSFDGEVWTTSSSSWFDSVVRVWRVCAGLLSRCCGGGAIAALRQSIMKIERKHIRSDDGDKVGGINKYCNDVACGSENNIEVITNGGRVLTCKKLVLGDVEGRYRNGWFSE